MDHYPHSIYHALISHSKLFGRLSTARQDNSWDSCKEDTSRFVTTQNVPVQLQKRAWQWKMYQYSYKNGRDNAKCTNTFTTQGATEKNVCNDISIFLGPQYRGRTSPAILLRGWGTVQYYMRWGCNLKYQWEEGEWGWNSITPRQLGDMFEHAESG